MKKEQLQRMGVSSSESKAGRALVLFKPACEYGRGRFPAEVAIVVPPPAVNTCRIVEICNSVPSLGGRRSRWNQHTAVVAGLTFIRRASAFACCRRWETGRCQCA